MRSINTSQCLPPELTVQSVEDILHRIGLPLDSTKSYPNRRLLFNPIIIFIFLTNNNKNIFIKIFLENIFIKIYSKNIIDKLWAKKLTIKIKLISNQVINDYY